MASQYQNYTPPEELFFVRPHVTEVTNESVRLFIDAKLKQNLTFVWDTKFTPYSIDTLVTQKCKRGQNYIVLNHPEPFLDVERITLISDRGYRQKFSVVKPYCFNSLKITSGTPSSRLSSMCEFTDVLVHLTRSIPNGIRSMRKAYSKFGAGPPSAVHCFCVREQLKGASKAYFDGLYTASNSIIIEGKMSAHLYVIGDVSVVVCQDVELLEKLIRACRNIDTPRVLIVTTRSLLIRPRLQHRLLSCNSVGISTERVSRFYNQIVKLVAKGKSVEVVCGGTTFSCSVEVRQDEDSFFRIHSCGSMSKGSLPGDKLYAEWCTTNTVDGFHIFEVDEIVHDKSLVSVEYDYDTNSTVIQRNVVPDKPLLQRVNDYVFS